MGHPQVGGSGPGPLQGEPAPRLGLPTVRMHVLYNVTVSLRLQYGCLFQEGGIKIACNMQMNYLSTMLRILWTPFFFFFFAVVSL